MSRYHSYLNSTIEILQLYKGEEPFAAFLKQFFARRKKYGSKDRRQISHLCYCYFRLGKTGAGLSVEERILTALFLCSDAANELLQQLKPGWNEQINLDLAEKIRLLNSQEVAERISLTEVFPWNDELSTGIAHEEFCESFFKQPDLFLRLRPGKEKRVMEKLGNAGIDFHSISDNCLSLSNSSKLDDVIELNREAVVQDYNSQRVGELLSAINGHRSTISIWDCCAASGGKSIMAIDTLGSDIDLTVSDIRESIIQNLKKRFAEAGIKNYQSFIADLSIANRHLSTIKYDLIICDAPCSGSGTWGRTPEQLYYFDKEKINYYSSLQKRIVSNAIKKISPGGYFLYITCSVFKRENEEVAGFIKDNFSLELVDSKLLTGYNNKADTMFAVLFKRTS